MQLIRGYKNQAKQTDDCVATIGNFDGVHLGHQKIIHRVTDLAKQMGKASAVILFEPHPKEFFLKHKSPPRISSLRQKYLALKKLGVDKLLVLRFDQHLASMAAEDFIQKILIDSMAVKHLVVGDDFRFGYQRQGDYELLNRYSKTHFSLEPTETIYVEEPLADKKLVRVSSTRIRQALMDNDFVTARCLLGRDFSLSGKVQYGRQLGRSIGFPTANIAMHRKNFPLAGVYWGRATWCEKDQSANQDLADTPKTAWAVANCGVRPTIDGHNFKLEVHLLGMPADLYGIELTFEFLGFLRAEKKFDGIDALSAQIARDVKKAEQAIEDQQP